MRFMRFPALLATVSLGAVLTGCVVAPIEPYPVAAYPPHSIYMGAYIAPPPVVVLPAPIYYRGFRGGYYGHRHWR